MIIQFLIKFCKVSLLQNRFIRNKEFIECLFVDVEMFFYIKICKKI